MIEFPQVEPGQLLDFFQAVNQRVAVHKQLTRGLGHIQIVLKELLDGEQGFLVE